MARAMTQLELIRAYQAHAATQAAMIQRIGWSMEGATKYQRALNKELRLLADQQRTAAAS